MFQTVFDKIVFRLARNVHNLHPVIIGKMLMHFKHGFINAVRAAAAAGNENRLFRRVERKFHQSLITRAEQNIVADRIARKHRFSRWKIFRGTFVADGYLIDEFSQNFVRNARNGILFLNERRNAHQRRRHQNRAAHVAARTDSDIRLEFLYNAARLDQRAECLAQYDEVLCRQMAFKAAYLQRGKRYLLARNDVRFQSFFRTDIQKLCIRYQFFYIVY